MSTITVPRPDVATGDVVHVLERGLGPHYHVLAADRTARPDLTFADDPDAIVIGTGACRVYQAHVRIVRRADRTEIRVRAGGRVWDRLINTFGAARKVGEVLRRSPLLDASR